ncbi:uncharacterized protein PITG_00925 [Phytophthora infestans T30-4]|uniref:Uncharacterized protein n=1 Tax=Phytophthora infestans (strain T30-4) TaxID=403677 RepID=D0MS10_PHYIT|nr:uncharacterized protein PITG_00925 [Phytophthora infestans T30-4]EEY58279.1 conserved hypothetical protein [Phytophthora infestans T30-4]|eukprot:XP_002909465.1 conserved hypothetical protein [Phytophthora infestans T30-4]
MKTMPTYSPCCSRTEARGRSATTFRPTTLEQQIYNVIGHTDNQGKDAQCILECTQARESRIRGAPPVLRGAFDFGFHVRGLSVMHFERVRRATPLDASGSVINMTDFSRKNGLQSATTDPSYTVFMDALTNLRQFGRKFYNADTMDRLLLWINMKLGKFRGLVISDGLAVAILVKDEFSLHDSLLAVLLYDLQKAKLIELEAMLKAQQHATTSMHSRPRESRPTRQSSGVPKSLTRTLPKQGSLELCLKYLSKTGCNGNGVPGKFFSKYRAHFRPKSLSPEAKTHIETHFGGLAPEFVDL